MSAAEPSPFAVSWWAHLLSGWVHSCPRFWAALGNLESAALGHVLDPVRVVRPLYVCGLARSGSTLLHEILAAHPDVATQRVKDFPFVYTPCWWRPAASRLRPAPPRERAHGDRLFLTADSPEALEEMIWMAFFPACHRPDQSSLMGADDPHPAFEEFYRIHIRKLLYSERRTRYAAKANYHVARLLYLQRLFPDARFFLPVRDPVGHIGSLMRQHRRFSEAGRLYPRSVAALQRAGHFEFGLDRRPINLGDAARTAQIQQLWAAGEEVRGWARYWAVVHDYLADLLEAAPLLQAATLVVPHEDMCATPEATLHAVLAHADLPGADVAARFAGRIARPEYYSHDLTARDRDVIREETATAAGRWGYAPA